MTDLQEDNKKKSHKLNIINIWKFIVNIAIYSIVVLILIFIYIAFHIFVIRYCLFGLLIGCAVSYGLGKNKYANKKILSFLIFLSAVFIVLETAIDGATLSFCPENKRFVFKLFQSLIS